MIRALLAARYVTFAAVVILLVALAWSGQASELRAVDQLVLRRRRPLHGGSISRRPRRSATIISSSWSTTIPALLTPAGAGPGFRAGRRGRPGTHRRPCSASSRSTPCRLLWAIDDALLALDRLPAIARNLALNAAKRTVKNVDLKTNAMTVAGAVRAAAADPAALAALKDRLTRHPLFLGTLIDATGTTTAVVVRLRKTHQHNVIETVAELRRIGRRVRGAAPARPAGGRRPAGAPGRRLRGDRGRRPPPGGRRHDLDRRGDPFGRSEPVVGDRADARRLGGLAGHRGDPGDASISSCRSRAARWSRRSSS